MGGIADAGGLRGAFAWLEPPAFHDRDRQRRATVLHWALIITGTLAVILGFSSSLVYSESAGRLAAAFVEGTVFLFTVFGLWLLRRGHLDAVSIALPTVIWLTLTLASAWVGGLRAAGVFMYPAIVLTAGFLVSVRAAVVFALLCSLSALALGLASDHGLLPHSGPVPTLRLWVTLTTAIIAAAGAVWLSLGTLQAALRETEDSERRYARLFHGAPDGIVSLAADGRIESINPAAATLLGVHGAEATGRRLAEFIPTPELGRPSLEDSLAEQTPVLAQLSPLGRDAVWVEVNSRSETDEAGARSMELTLRDVTERHNAESERRSLEAELNEARKLESVGRLAGGIAHDFNNLLTVIHANSELLMDRGDSGDLRERLREMRDAAEYGATLTRQLLAFASRQVLEPEWIDINQEIRNISPLLARLAGADVAIHMELSPELGSIRADPSQLQQVIINLVTNARDALPGGGQIHIETSRARDGEPSGRPAQVEDSVGWVRLEVRDTGVGMDEETLAQAFEPFFSRKASGRGTGLGLASVYGIVRQSEGHVDVSSRVGHGTTFSIYLPEHARRPAQAEKPPQPLPSEASSETVLLVEDDGSVRHVLKRMLEHAGYRVVSAACAEEATVALGAEPCSVDLLLTDVVMPGLSGPGLAEQLSRVQPDLKVVFMSGHTEDEAISEEVRQRGALFLAKPPSRSELLAKLRQALEPPSAGPAPPPAA
jgi:PAS domain S-box-containing protein